MEHDVSSRCRRNPTIFNNDKSRRKREPNHTWRVSEEFKISSKREHTLANKARRDNQSRTEAQNSCSNNRDRRTGSPFVGVNATFVINRRLRDTQTSRVNEDEQRQARMRSNARATERVFQQKPSRQKRKNTKLTLFGFLPEEIVTPVSITTNTNQLAFKYCKRTNRKSLR